MPLDTQYERLVAGEAPSVVFPDYRCLTCPRKLEAFASLFDRGGKLGLVCLTPGRNTYHLDRDAKGRIYCWVRRHDAPDHTRSLLWLLLPPEVGVPVYDVAEASWREPDV